MSGPSDEEIETAVIGLTVHDRTIDLAEYDPAWPELFNGQPARIRKVLGPAVFAVEHVGSTAVPGLAAKPIIDIVLTVRDPSDEACYVSAFGAAVAPLDGVIRARRSVLAQTGTSATLCSGQQPIVMGRSPVRSMPDHEWL